jgi:hypothetical protein
MNYNIKYPSLEEDRTDNDRLPPLGSNVRHLYKNDGTFIPSNYTRKRYTDTLPPLNIKHRSDIYNVGKDLDSDSSHYGDNPRDDPANFKNFTLQPTTSKFTLPSLTRKTGGRKIKTKRKRLYKRKQSRKRKPSRKR